MSASPNIKPPQPPSVVHYSLSGMFNTCGGGGGIEKMRQEITFTRGLFLRCERVEVSCRICASLHPNKFESEMLQTPVAVASLL